MQIAIGSLWQLKAEGEEYETAGEVPQDHPAGKH
jgi:hypothetical protein